MPKKGAALLSEHQPSMTEWLAAIGEEKESAAFRQEDNAKDDRLELLYQAIGLQYERPVEFAATDLAEKTPEFLKYLDEHGGDLCALRLVPRNPELPKLRNRGLTVREVYETWFPKQPIDHKEYKAYFRPHAEDYPWAMVLVVRDEGIFGEMIPGQHAQLTHGDTAKVATRFRFDFTTWEWQNEGPGAKDALMLALKGLEVPEDKQAALRERLGAEFAHGYLLGYYECVLWFDGVVRFSDYNRLLYKRIPFPPSYAASVGEIKGVVAFKGIVTGTARIVMPETLSAPFEQGDILVTDNTDIRYVPLMQKAGAIVTDRGGMLSHASIVARELKKPCIVATQSATTTLKSGMQVEVDADRGVVTILK